MLWKLSLGKSLMCTLLKKKLNTLNNIVTILTQTNPHAYPRPRKPPSVFWTPPHNVDRIDSCYYEYSKVTNLRNLTLLNHSTFILGDQLVITGYYVIRVIMSILSVGNITPPKSRFSWSGKQCTPCNAPGLQGGCAFILYHLRKKLNKRPLS